jgi:hypothetical protein
MKKTNPKINNMKIAVFIVACMLYVKQTSGQINEVNKFINNDSIKFDLVMTMPDFENGIYHSDYALIVNSLDSAERVIVQSLNKNQWVQLLKNSKSDWAANIILYSMYKKSAGIFRAAVKTRDSWIENSRQADIDYWQSFLK